MSAPGNQGGGPPQANHSNTRRPQRGQNITGPTTALSDFLSTYNISARNIRRAAQRGTLRRSSAAQAEDEPGDDTINGHASSPGATADDGNGDEEEDEEEEEEDIVARPTRRTRQTAAKKSTPVKKPPPPAKKAKKRKRSDDDSDVSSDDNDSVKDYMSLLRSRAGQVDHCELCLKKFTITPYTKAGPNGGLLCADCGRIIKDDKRPEPDKTLPKLKSKPATKGFGKKRQMKSQIMNGTFKIGTKSLTTLCVETLARNVDLVESLGDMAPHLIDKIAQRLSKRRLVDSNTLTLFLEPSTEELRIYDAAKLTEEDFIRCFSICQKLRLFKFRNGIHFNDNVMNYLVTRHLTLTHLSIHGSNLISEQSWVGFLAAKGGPLETLKVHFTDKHFGDPVIAAVVEHCPSLKSFSLQHIAELSTEGIRLISGMKNLQHLSLQLNDKIDGQSCADMVTKIGKGLKTLSLRRAVACDDELLCAIHGSCQNLVKLRLTECNDFTDEGFVNLFTDWKNPELEYVDFAKCRHLEANEARNHESGIGFCSGALRALMNHSGAHIRHLNLDSARYISTDAFEEVFAEGKTYPNLQYIELSFCEAVTDYIIERIFKACPALKELVVFGCMLVKGLVRVPRGKLLIGVPNIRGMIIEGDDD